MILVAGLGNPGEKYQQTRHNAGFMFLDELREFLGWDTLYQVTDWNADRVFQSILCWVKVDSEKRVLLAKPMTFMNESGFAIRKIVDKNEIQISSGFVLVHDDLDLKLGTYKIQRDKAPRVHNGVNNVQDHLGNTDFLRVRIGIDNRDQANRLSGEEYVLGKVNKEEMVLIREASLAAIKELRTILKI
ncbi:aminoacyl-tRNA hydrolase [Candidatus Dojkabacteria bacterium]|uniref:Peptidyl-tRNA hydrolase n=1 Tax=Candidatus Dojkabacteria bacterium TaxID=2099670 RepID=A0A955HY40_9BACT|nr:aminoacyl-tRNA hydrolase [Candidatus Dojkabacteria bacterium]